MNNIISVEQCDVALFISKVHPPSSVKSTCTRCVCVCVCVVDVVYMLTMHLSSTSEYCRRASRAYREERQHNVKSVHERRVCAPTGGETEREREKQAPLSQQEQKQCQVIIWLMYNSFWSSNWESGREREGRDELNDPPNAPKLLGGKCCLSFSPTHPLTLSLSVTVTMRVIFPAYACAKKLRHRDREG